MGYFRQSIKGVSWMGALRVSMRGLGFIKIAILARLLAPAQFGIFGIASLVLAFLEVITETGINVFLIQEKEDLKKYINTAFIVSMARGALISLILILLSPFIARFFEAEGALSLLYLIAAVPFLRGFINPAIVKYQKNLLFNKEYFLRLSIFVVDGLVAVSVAFATKGAASLVWGLLAGVLLEVILSHRLIKPRPRLVFEKEKLQKVINRGKWLTAAGFFNYLFREGDDIVVGKLLASSQLGYYQMAYKISTLPITEISDVIIKVAFPVYTKIEGDKKRLRRAFIRTFLAVAFPSVLFGFSLFYFAKPIVAVILGPRWLSIVPALKILSVFGVVRAITSVSYPLALSRKKQEYVMVITLVGIIGLGLTIIPLVTAYGILGAAYSALFGALLALPAAFIFSLKLLS